MEVEKKVSSQKSVLERQRRERSCSFLLVKRFRRRDSSSEKGGKREKEVGAGGVLIVFSLVASLAKLGKKFGEANGGTLPSHPTH